jgi:hypothetical protein
MRSVATAASIAAAVFGLAACAAGGGAVTPGWECIPTTQGQSVVSGGTGSAPACGSATTAVLAPTYVSSGVGGKPTVEFSAVNVQIVSGSGSTSGAVNGEGNLVIGYAENANGYSQAGSHDLIVGSNNGWKGYGELVGGTKNQSIGNFAAAFGQGNKASGTASLAAGTNNIASGSQSSAIGGDHNTAKGAQSSVTGGDFNLANDTFASVAGGCENIAGPSTSVSATCLTGAEAILGGFENTAAGLESTVSGGEVGFASGGSASVAGGQFNGASGGGASVAGGDENTASGDFSSVLGGFFNSEPTRCASIPASPGNC